MSNPQDHPGGFYVTAKTISTAVSVFALCSAIYIGISKVNAYSYRLDKLESDKVELSSAVNQLSTKIDSLNAKIVDLTIALNRVQDRYESREHK